MRSKSEPGIRAWTRPSWWPATARALLVFAALLPGAAAAHDTWLEVRAAVPGRVELALTTGELFPVAQTAVAAASLVDRGCTSTSGRRVALRAAPASDSALPLLANPGRGETLGHCWVQTEAFEVELSERLVPLYLREIAAPDRVHEAWAEHRRLGLPWRERYTKHARITLDAAQHSSAVGARRHPAEPMPFDIEIDATGPLRVGDTLRFRVWRDGQPLAGQAVELRGEMSRFGVWRRTDADGRASVPVPLAGRWVLRATDLRPLQAPGHWESRFATHAFAVAPVAAPVSEP